MLKRGIAATLVVVGGGLLIATPANAQAPNGKTSVTGPNASTGVVHTHLTNNDGIGISGIDGGGVIDCACAGAWSVGDRAAATVDAPQGASGIFAGDEGDVHAGSTSFPDWLLVSWDGWSSGHNGNGFDDCPGANPTPDNSGWWVQCPDIEPAGGGGGVIDCACDSIYSVDDRVAATVDAPQGAAGIFAGDEGTVYSGSTSFPDWLLISWDGWSSGHNGNGFDDCPGPNPTPGNSGWWVQCPDVEFAGGGGGDVDCVCDDRYDAGDRVMALVDSPSGASGISAGDEGSVICGADGSPPILISWDNWQQGHNGNGFCVCPIDELPDNSGWYVQCEEIDFAVVDECKEDVNNDGVVDILDLLAVLAAWGLVCP